MCVKTFYKRAFVRESLIAIGTNVTNESKKVYIGAKIISEQWQTAFVDYFGQTIRLNRVKTI